MSKQTAVEWLFAHLLPFLSFSDAKEREHFRKCLEEAKAMEREQMKESFVDGHSLCRCVTDSTDEAKECFDEWFEQFKKTKGGEQ